MQQHFHYPISFERAHKHMLANRIFKGDTKENTDQCPCCARKIGQEEIETRCNIQTDQLSFLGPGVPLFFLYLKSIIQMLLIMCVIFMGFALYSNAVGNTCSLDVTCIASAFNIIAIINKQSNLEFLSIQTYLALSFIVVTIIYFHYFRYKARQLQLICDEVVDSPSDYAIIIRRLPKQITERHIQELIASKLKDLTPEEQHITGNLKIVKIILSYELREYSKVHEQNINNFKKMIQENTASSFQPKQIPPLDKTSSIAIVIFQSQLSKSFFIHNATICQRILQFFCTSCMPLSDLQIKETKISIERAPQPDDILWENSGITMNGAIYRKTLYAFFLIIVLSIGGGMQYGLAIWSYNTSDSTLKNIITFSSSLLVTIFNAFLTVVITILTEKERNQTLTEFQTVLMVKMTVFQFLNAGIFVILAQTIVNFENFTLKQQICEQITTIVILNAFLPNIILLFLEYSQIINKVKRYIVQKKWMIATQVQVNQLYAGPCIDLPHKYAYILKTLLLTALYATFAPIVIAISMIGLILFYFVQKFLYTRSYRVPNNVSSESFKTAVELLEYFLITFAIGEIVIYYYFYKYVFTQIPVLWTSVILISLILATLNSALPMDTINEKIFKIQESSHSKIKYSQIQQKFQVTYEMINPAYKTNRKRHNIKDLLGLLTLEKKGLGQSKKKEIQMVDLMRQSGLQTNNKMIKQPLLEMNTQLNQKINKHMEVNNQSIAHHITKDKHPTSLQPVQESTNKVDKLGKKQMGLIGQEVSKNELKDDGSLKNGTLVGNQAEKVEKGEPQKQIKIIIKPPTSKITQQSIHEQSTSRIKKPKTKVKLVHAQYNYQKIISQIFSKKHPYEGLSVGEKDNRQRSKSNSSMPNEQSKEKNDIQDNIINLYADLDKKTKLENQSKEIVNFQNVPISSKYHQSGGKINIYEEYIIQKSKNKKQQALKKNIIQKAKKQKKQREKYVQPNFVSPSPGSTSPTSRRQPEKNRFKFFNIRQIDHRDEQKDRQTQKEQNKSLSAKETLIFQQNTYNNLLDKANKINHIEVSEKYRENISNISKIQRQNSSSSMYLSTESKNLTREPEFKDPLKQKKATYDPLKLQKSYKQFFKQKQSQDVKILDKGKIMKYLGMPFSTFVKEQKEDNNPFFK